MTAAWTSVLFALLPHPTSSRVLLVASDTGWSLPSTRVTGKIELTVGLATREMSRALGFPLLAYRYAQNTVDEPTRKQEGIFAFEGLEQDAALPGPNLWVSPEDLVGLRLSQPHHRRIIKTYLRELETGITPHGRQTWEHPGWLGRVASWIGETLDSRGYKVLAPPEQVRWWSLSCVLRVATTQGNLYFKASARQPLFANEPVLLGFLAGLCPGRVPPLIASDTVSGWMLVEDVGPALGTELPIEDRNCAALRRSSAGYGRSRRAAPQSRVRRPYAPSPHFSHRAAAE
jgi:hypothetical protein